MLGYGAVFPFEIIYLHEARGFGLGVAGFVVGLLSGVAVFVAPVAGAVIDRVGARATAVGAGAGAGRRLRRARVRDHAGGRGRRRGLAGIGNGALQPSQSALMAALAPRELLQRASGVSRVAVNVGLGLGAAIGGVVAGRPRRLRRAVPGQRRDLPRLPRDPRRRRARRGAARARRRRLPAGAPRPRAAALRADQHRPDRRRLGRAGVDRAAVRARARDRAEPDRPADPGQRRHGRARPAADRAGPPRAAAASAPCRSRPASGSSRACSPLQGRRRLPARRGGRLRGRRVPARDRRSCR